MAPRNFDHLTPEGAAQVRREEIQEGWEQAVARANGSAAPTSKIQAGWDKALARIGVEAAREGGAGGSGAQASVGSGQVVQSQRQEN